MSIFGLILTLRVSWTKKFDTNIDLSQEFHTYAVEYDENRVKFLFDGNVVAIYPRLFALGPIKIPIVGCNSLRKVYVLNPFYPKYGNPLNVIANVALNANAAWNELVPEGTMEIDYIKVYERINYCPNLENLVIIDQDETWTTDRDIKVLIVREDVTLNLDNCTIKFSEYGRIYLEEGAKLIMEGAVLTSCSPYVKWGGIKAEDKAYIDMSSSSKIENATTGVHLGPRRYSSSGQIVWDDTPTIEVSSYSGFKNCDLGIYLGYGLTSSKLSGRSWFIDCGTAILTNRSSGLILDRVEFYNNSVSIRAIDSYLHVRDGNFFHGGETGISIEGTFPGSSGIDIGDMGLGYNYFASNMNGIICQGTEHPVGANIVNCKFSNVTQLATGFNGSNQYMYYNNLVENSPNGVLSASTGDNFNTTRCNEFKNISNADNLYIFINNRTQFLENLSSGTHNVNYGFLSATMPNDIGSPNNPAGNCFSDNGVDIRTPLNPFVPGNQFNYHYYDDVNANPCQEPMNNGNYTKLESDFEPDHCGGDIGIFRLIDPDSDGVKGFVPDTVNVASFSSHIPKDSISAQILHWINEVVSEGGDDPRTPANEESTSVTPLRSKKEAVLDQWIRYAIYRGNEEGECAFVDSILSPLSTFRWQKRRYGQKIMCGDIDGASRFLDSIPSGNPDIAAFKTVQNINLKRLRGFGEGNWLTEAEISDLQSIGESELPSSGYARSLYRLFTGNNLPFNIPDMNADTSIITPKISSSTIELAEKVNIFPNPSTDIIYIQSDHEISNVVISDITGKVKISKKYSTEINVNSLPKGLYFVNLHYIDGRVSTHKVLIN